MSFQGAVAPAVLTDDTERMRAAVLKLEMVQKRLESENEHLAEQLADAESQANDYANERDEALDEIGTLEAQVDEIAGHTDALARTWAMLKSGRADDALRELERVLSHLDSAWRTRAVA